MRSEFGSVWLDGAASEVAVEDGRIARLAPSAAPARAMMLPLLVDAHVHLDKTHAIDRILRRPASLFEAIELAAADEAHWSAEDLRRRAGLGLEQAEAHGIGALRTHVDWSQRARPLAWDVIGALAEEWRGRVEVERAALVPLDLFADAGAGAGVAEEVAATGGALGAFVYRNADLAAKLGRVFDLADRFGLRLDFHVDEGLDPEAQGFDAIVAETARRGMAGRVLCGHGCALSIRPEAEVARLLDRAAEAGVALGVLPTTNCYLQDAQAGRTPRLRGLAPLQEARAAGVEVAVALDNVRDAFYPYGEYDLLDAWRQAVLMGHLDPERWLDAVTAAPARALGRRAPGIAVGEPADFILIDASGPADLVGRARASLTVWRAGNPLRAMRSEHVA